MKKRLLKPPKFEEFVRLLMAWRVWLVGALIGALLAAGVYALFPAQYRARATVLVDQNAEQVVPVESSDRVIYTYLQRETDKLVELAWSDTVLGRVTTASGIAVSALRNGVLHLSQPSDGGWHFYADASTPQTAAEIASAWAGSFVDEVQAKPEGISNLLEINYTQGQNLSASRTVPLGIAIFAGSLLGAAVLALGLLFFDRREG